MNTCYINPLDAEKEKAEKEKEENNCKHEYPLYSTTRLKRNTLERLKRCERYGDSMDEIVVLLLDVLEGKETSESERAW